jgi:hypothetical protein
MQIHRLAKREGALQQKLFLIPFLFEVCNNTLRKQEEKNDGL